MHKGIILAAGKGTRLRPLTDAISKHLLNIYDKPMIYYPINLLLQACIRDILIITNPNDILNYQNLLGDGGQLGINIEYKIQNEPKGIAEAFIIGENFIQNSKCVLILGDNIFLNYKFNLKDIINREFNASFFSYPVKNPNDFGVAVIKDNNQLISIDEKPKNPKSNLAITGLYAYDNNVIKIAKSLSPSERNELEITDLNNYYIKNFSINHFKLDSSTFWIDAGNLENLDAANKFVYDKQKQSEVFLGYLEISAYKNGWINESKVVESIVKYKNTTYGDNLAKFVKAL